MLRPAYAMRASEARFTSYSRKVFIPLTQLCYDHCAYCTFAKGPESSRAPFLTVQQVLDIAREGKRVGCKGSLVHARREAGAAL